MSGFGAGLGSVIGSSLGASDLSAGQDLVNGVSSNFDTKTQPYSDFGASFLSPATSAITELHDNAAHGVMGYNQFADQYQASPGVQYQLGQATEAQNESAASTGQLLSGTNLRALSNINQGIAATGMNNAYDEYLKGNQQGFGQLETALGNMFQAIGVGQTATGQQATVDTAQMGAQSQLAQAQAKNDQSKGSGLGSMFGGLGSLAAMF